MKKYTLRNKETPKGVRLTCACGKCNPDFTLSENAKENFKRMMDWSEEDFNNKMVEIKKGEEE